MMNVSVTADWQGRPLSALNDLIGKRVARMGETCRDACIATAINVVNSLRKATRKAPQRANAKSFRLELTPYVGGWMKEGGRFHRVARVPGTGSRAPIYPVNHAGQRYVRGETIKVWRITPRHGERMKWEKNRNDGCWYVFAQSEAVARRLAVELMSRVLRKECGMAQTALGHAMAWISTRPAAPSIAKSERARRIAKDVLSVHESVSGGEYSLTIVDGLDFAKHALKGGDSAISLAMMKAANRTAGILNHHYTARFFDDTIPTPFPEVAHKKIRL